MWCVCVCVCVCVCMFAALWCIVCNAGQYSAAAATTCTDCAAGTADADSDPASQCTGKRTHTRRLPGDATTTKEQRAQSGGCLPSWVGSPASVHAPMILLHARSARSATVGIQHMLSFNIMDLHSMFHLQTLCCVCTCLPLRCVQHARRASTLPPPNPTRVRSVLQGRPVPSRAPSMSRTVKVRTLHAVHR